jgi:hypothetical protein
MRGVAPTLSGSSERANLSLGIYYQTQQIWGLPSLACGRKQIQFPKRYILLRSLEYWTMDKFQNRSNSECYTQSLEPLSTTK